MVEVHRQGVFPFVAWIVEHSPTEGSVLQSLPRGRDFEVVNPRLGLSKAWIIKRTVSGVKREVQCLLKIGILAKDRRQRAKNFAPARGDGQAQNAIFLAFSAYLPSA